MHTGFPLLLCYNFGWYVRIRIFNLGCMRGGVSLLPRPRPCSRPPAEWEERAHLLALPASYADTLCFRSGRDRSKLANYGSSGNDSHVQAILYVLLTRTKNVRESYLVFIYLFIRLQQVLIVAPSISTLHCSMRVL